jgi:hypothetical protein
MVANNNQIATVDPLISDDKFLPNAPINNTLLGDLLYKVLEEKLGAAYYPDY